MSPRILTRSNGARRRHGGRRATAISLVVLVSLATLSVSSGSNAMSSDPTVAGAAPSSAASGTPGLEIPLAQRPLARSDTPVDSGVVRWATNAAGGTTSCDAANNGCAVAVDHLGNVYTVTTFKGSEEVRSATTSAGVLVSATASVTLAPPANDGAFIAKWSPAGFLVWAAQISTAENVIARAVAVDATGSVFVAGSFGGTATFSSGTSSAGVAVSAASVEVTPTLAFSPTMFVAKWTPSGVIDWVAHGGGVAGNVNTSGNGLAVDASGAVYATGSFANFDAGAPVPVVTFYSATNAAGVGVSAASASAVARFIDNDVYVAKWSNDGRLDWVAQSGAVGGGDEARAVAVDAAGSAFVVGSFDGSTTFWSATTSAGVPASTATVGATASFSAFVAKWSTTGEVIWVGQVESDDKTLGERAFGVAVDPAGAAYVAGLFNGNTRFFSATNAAGVVVAAASISATGVGNDDLFLAKWSNDGRLDWATQASGRGYELGQGVAVEPAGSVFVTGSFESPVVFLSATDAATAANSGVSLSATNIGNADAFVAAWSLSGVVQSVAQIGGPGGEGSDPWYSERGFGVAVDRSGTAPGGAVYAIGAVSGSATVFSATVAALGVAPSASIPLSANNADSHMFLARWNSRDFVPPAPGGGGAPPSIPSITPPGATTGTSGGFEPLTPQRVLDTRGSGPVAAGSITRVDLDNVLAGRRRDETRSSRGADTAVVVNVTAVGARAPGYLTVFACDTPLPNVSNLNYPTGGAIANTAISAISTSGELCIYSSAPTNLLIDITGWFDNGYTPTPPTRLVDTRTSRPAAANSITRVPLPTAPANTRGAAMNITAVNPTQPGYLTAYDCDQPTSTSTLNVTPGTTIANLAISGITTTGDICIYTSTTTQLLVDHFGWFDQIFTPITNRILDTRTTTPLPAGTTTALPITARTSLPANTNAVAITLTAVNPTQPGYATITACNTTPGTQPGTPPNTSTINYTTDQTIATTTITATNTGTNSISTLCLYTSTTTHYLIDITGTYTN